jgi:hypothetical protein
MDKERDNTNIWVKEKSEIPTHSSVLEEKDGIILQA